MPFVYCAGAMGIDSGRGRELFAVGRRGVGLVVVAVVVVAVLFVMARSVAEEGGGDDVFLRVIGMSNSCSTTRPPCEGVTRSSPSGTTTKKRRQDRRER